MSFPSNEAKSSDERKSAQGPAQGRTDRASGEVGWTGLHPSQRELSEKASLTEPTTHTALQRLEALGYLERRKMGGNKRRQHVFLTELGISLRNQLEPMALEVNTVALDGLSERDQDRLRAMLFTIIGNLQRDEEHGISEGRKMPSTRASGES